MKKRTLLIMATILIVVMLGGVFAGCVKDAEDPSKLEPTETPNKPEPTRSERLLNVLKGVSKSLTEYDEVGIAPKGFGTDANVVTKSPLNSAPMNEEYTLPEDENIFNFDEEDFTDAPAELHGRIGNFVEEVLFKGADGEEGSITDYGFEVTQTYYCDDFLVLAISEFDEVQVQGNMVIERENPIVGDGARFADSSMNFIVDSEYGRVYGDFMDTEFTVSNSTIVIATSHYEHDVIKVSFTEENIIQTVINPRGGKLVGVYNGTPIYCEVDINAIDPDTGAEYLVDRLVYAKFIDENQYYPIRCRETEEVPISIYIYYKNEWVSITELLNHNIEFYNKDFEKDYINLPPLRLYGVSEDKLLIHDEDQFFPSTLGANYLYSRSYNNDYDYYAANYSVGGETGDTVTISGQTFPVLEILTGDYIYFEDGEGISYIDFSIADGKELRNGLYKTEVTLEATKEYYLESISEDNTPNWVLLSEYVQENTVTIGVPII